MQANAAARARFFNSDRFGQFDHPAVRQPAQRRRALVRGSLAALGAGLGIAFAGAAFAQQPAQQAPQQASSGIKVETLLKTTKSWDGTPYKGYPSGSPQLSVLKIEIPAHSVLPWHTHPMPNAGYVVSGEITVEKKDGEKQTVKAGQVLPETVGSVHRGVTGDSPVTLIVFYAGTEGMPLSQHP
ncbi:cupin domain-containing protein [Paraburkholderia edwinii]|uniref:Cupin domain-containing protein n=1 Tax=Paraburkholderia edwinii TaxID=2861782 RepID=A0ABX8UXH6_9BURK|nr:cupin domain-containing protein [Paraburkholderia edwinii]QYD73694.1 cupin domain-containing protein [Paraburkholderia edwinii]